MPPRYTWHNGIYQRTGAAETHQATIHVVGDLMCNGQIRVYNKTGTFNQSFEHVRPIFAQADFVIGNLETVLSHSAPYATEMNRVDKNFHRNAPPTFLESVRYAGIDAVATANNHNWDAGYHGIVETVDALNDYELIHTGLFSAPEQQRYFIANVNGIKVGMLSYTIPTNRKAALYFTERGREVVTNEYSRERLASDMQLIRSAGAEFVFVYIHWLYEQNTTEMDPRKVDYAQEIADEGTDYIVGTHPHALNLYDKIVSKDGRVVPVAYSLGNFVASMTRPVNLQSMILEINLVKDGGTITVTDSYIPCLLRLHFRDQEYVVVPLVEPFIDEISEAEQQIIDIAKILGDKISIKK
jgi:poly-gamma-glutamate synthesis protein (capsule biosynthesis protein)